MARSFRRGSRTVPSTTKNNSVSSRAFRNTKAREANKDKFVKTSDGKVYKNYRTYKNAVSSKTDSKPTKYPSVTKRPVKNNGPSLRTNKLDLRDEFLKFQQDRKKEQEERREERLTSLRGTTDVMAQRAIQTGNPLMMRQAAITENIVLEGEGEYTSAYTQATDAVRKALSGEYLYGVSQEAWDEWQRLNTYEVDKEDASGNSMKVRMLRYNAAPPPVGYNEKSETIDIANAWRYYQQVDFVRNKTNERRELAEKEKYSMYANHADQEADTYNSHLDAIIGLATGHGLEGFKKYYSQYILKPLKYGNFSALGLNLLNDLGETLDTIPRGVKAVISSQKLLYGQDTFWTNEEGTTFTNQGTWVYSGGKDKQKKLMDLGAMDILRNSRYTSNYRSEAIQKIKEEGLWEDFLQFQEEYNSDYDRGSFEDALTALKEAYTTHKNYEADTGNLLADLTLEFVTDPTFLVGGAASAGETALKKASNNALTLALSEAHKNLDVLDESTGWSLNNLSKTLADDLLSKGVDEVEHTAHLIAKTLETKQVMTTFEADTFQKALVRNTKRIADEKAFTVVKSLHYANRAADKIDSTLLKTVFGAPYVAAKTVVPLAKKGANLGTVKFKVLKNAFNNRIYKGLLDSETDTVAITDADELLKRMSKEYLQEEHPEITGEVFEKVYKGVQHNCNKIDNIILDKWETVEEMDAAISEYISTITKGEFSDFNGFLSYVEKLNDEWQTLDDTVELVKNQFKKYDDYKTMLQSGENVEYKAPVVSGKKKEPPVIKEDKVIDKSQRLNGALKSDWRKLARKYGKGLSEESPYKVFFDVRRTNAPTLKEAGHMMRRILSEYNFATKGNMDEYADLVRFYNNLVETELSVDIQKNLQFNQFQKDKWAAYEEAVSNSYFKQLLDKFTDPSSATYKFMQSFLQSERTDLSPWITKHVSEMIEQVKSLDAFQTFKRRLELEHGPLNEDQKYRVLDTIFNRDWVNPHRLTDVNSSEMDTLITKVEAGLSALDGTESLALDNFRRIAVDFDNDIWKKYANELQDPEMRTRVYRLLEGGHEDPMADVRVQMLQAILRDPDAIAKYNIMSSRQDVIFYDIETRGLNMDNNEITCVAMKKWEPISDDASLDELLTMLEKEGKSYQTFTPESEIAERVSDSILEVNYKNRHDIPCDRASRLAEYNKRFGAETNGKTVTEKEMLNEIIADLDSSFKARGSEAPVLISHNNNNFDMKFVERRMIKHKSFPSHMKNLDEFIGKEQNTYKMLRSQFPDSTLSAEQEEYIRKAVADYARSMGAFSASMRVFEPGKFVQSVKEFNKVPFDKVDEAWAEAQHELASLKPDEIQQQFLDSLSDDKTMFALDPYHRTVASLDDDTIIKYFGEERLAEIRNMSDETFQKLWVETAYARKVEGSDSTMRMIAEDNPLDKIPRSGYRKVDVNSVAYYFDIIDQRIPQGVLMKMNSFAKACGADVTKRLQDTSMLSGRLQEFQAVINYVKSFAGDLDIYDDLYFLKYVTAPESLDEAYVMAQRLWDTFMGTTKYEEAQKYIKEGTAYDEIPEDIRGTVVALTKFSDDFDIRKVVSPDMVDIFRDTGKKYHYQLFKDIQNEDAYYLSQITENESVGKALVGHCKHSERALKTMSLLTHGNQFTKAKDAMLVHVMKKSREAIEHYLSLDKKSREIFRKECDKALSNMMEAQTAQVMDFISVSEKNLLEHLLYNNQVLVIPTKGSQLHMTQLGKLEKLLANESEFIHHTVDHQGYLWIGIKKEWQQKIEVMNDAAHVTEETEMSFFGRTEVYKRPKYNRISMPEGSLSDETFAMYFKNTEEQVYNMSRGASAGSLGIKHTMSKQSNLYANAPQGFLDNTLDLEFTCNERFWHNANYDMSLLGGMAERWKVGNQNDIDYLLATRQTLEETAKKTQTERMFVQGIFGAQEYLKVTDLFTSDMSDVDIAKAFKESSDMVCVRLTESSSTESGFFVEAVDTTTKAGVKQAKADEAIVIPYSMYSTLCDAINASKASTGFLKVYSKLVHLYKVGYLVAPGTWMRNFVDGTMKAIGDTGDPVGLLTNYLNAGTMLRKYKEATKKIAQARGVSHNTLADIERMWDSFGLDMSFQEYKFMDEWMQYDESGGESAVLKAVKENRKHKGTVDRLAKENNGGRALIDDSILKFEMLDEDDVRRMFQKTDISNEFKMTEDEFIRVFNKDGYISQSERMEYETIAKVLMSEGSTFKNTLGGKVQTINDTLLSPMSAIEEMIRLGEYMTLEAQGHTQSQIFHTLTKSQFNYSSKSPATQKLELIIPFYTFMHDNMIYWCKQVSENPRMLRYIEKIWGELSWDTSDYEPEEIIENYSLQAAMLSGNIPIGNNGFMLKLNPSFLDAFKMTYSPLERLYSGLFQPIQNVVQDAVRGSDARLLFGEQVFWTDNKSMLEIMQDPEMFGSTRERNIAFGEKLPLVGPLINRMFTIGPENMSRLPEGVPVQRFLTRMFPSVFGVIKNLNGPPEVESDDLSWDELNKKMALEGKLWDNNQQEFVSMDHFIPGGLNREFDFSKEGEWDEFCRLKKMYQGVVWDNNIKEFVKPEELTEGGLNDPDATWEEVLYYNGRMGLFYNQEAGKFVDINEWPLKEQKILRYTFFGEEYDEANDRWVQVTDPMKGFGTNVEVRVSEHEEKSFLERIGIIAAVFADAPDVIRELVRTPSKYFEATQDDLNAFMKVMEQIGLKSYQNPRSTEQRKLPEFTGRSYNNRRTIYARKPQESTPSRYAKTAYQGVQSAGTVYSKPYQFGDNQSGLRMATSGYPAYDEYYNYNYVYSYKYRNPNRGVADFPQSKLGIQRYMRLRTDALTRKMRLRAEYNIEDINSLRGVSPKNRIQSLKLHWWMR